jgi:hypothetical protein
MGNESRHPAGESYKLTALRKMPASLAAASRRLRRERRDRCAHALMLAAIGSAGPGLVAPLEFVPRTLEPPGLTSKAVRAAAG